MFVSWCTSDTKKCIGGTEYDSEYCVDGSVYLLNPFGEPYEEKSYNGTGFFNNQNIFELLAKWNYPELCKDKDGRWLSDNTLYEIGCYISSNYTQLNLKYPVKIVENICPYKEANISPQIAGFGYISNTVGRLKEDIKESFLELDNAQKYSNLINTIDTLPMETQLTILKITDDHNFLDMMAQKDNINNELLNALMNKAKNEHSYSTLSLLTFREDIRENLNVTTQERFEQERDEYEL